ncbi:MAG: hypothetical protein J6W64_04840 [Bacilli bacterium]|nr:hypothetical protein [Bacilli bacterium]
MSRLIYSEKLVNKIKKPIVVLDLNTNALVVLNKLKEVLPNENIIHINDLERTTYEVEDKDMILDIDGITSGIKRLLERVKKYDPKLLLVASDAIIEYGKELIEGLNIPYILITDVIIEEINKNYEFKNMAFFATQGIIEANLYQKNFHYTRLYNLNADNILDSIRNYKMKTSDSFNQMKVALFPLYQKDVDVIIPSIPNILMFKTEIFEYVMEENPSIVVLPVDKLLSDKALSVLSGNLNPKKANNPVYLVRKLDKENKNLTQVEKSLRKLYDKVLNLKYQFIYEE